MFKIEAEDGMARVGSLKTRHGTIETPLLTPVATKGAVKNISVDELKSMKNQAIICNSYLLYLRPGIDVIESAGGLHKFIGYSGAIFTDSGGFQMKVPGIFLSADDSGITFKDPFRGDKHFISPEISMENQMRIGGDAIMALDEMPLYGASENEVAAAVKRTTLWAERCLKAHTDRKQLLYGIVQGGIYSHLRETSAKQIGAMDFDGLAFGGLAIGEPLDQTTIALKAAISHVPSEKPKHFLGVGSPLQILDAVGLGCDTFDSTFPTQLGRHGYALTRTGRVSLDKPEHCESFIALDPDCDCYVCTQFTRAFLHHLFRLKEFNCARYVSYHNIYFLNKMLTDAKTAIQENRFEKFREEIRKGYSNSGNEDILPRVE